MATTTLFAYLLAVLVLFLVPGPAVLIVTARSLESGTRAGVATGVGVALGDLCHATLAVAGLSALLLTSATLFAIVKYAGVAYLAYLGVRALLIRRPSDAQTRLPGTGGEQHASTSEGEAIRQGFLSELLNPKTALFFLSFLPQFVDQAGASTTAQLALLGGIFVVASILYTSALAALVTKLADRFQKRPGSGAREVWGNRLVGVVFLAVAARVAFD